jgi:hypothetical protein
MQALHGVPPSWVLVCKPRCRRLPGRLGNSSRSDKPVMCSWSCIRPYRSASGLRAGILPGQTASDGSGGKRAWLREVPIVPRSARPACRQHRLARAAGTHRGVIPAPGLPKQRVELSFPYFHSYRIFCWRQATLCRGIKPLASRRTVGWFHSVQLFTQAVDEVRRGKIVGTWCPGAPLGSPGGAGGRYHSARQSSGPRTILEAAGPADKGRPSRQVAAAVVRERGAAAAEP